MPSPLSPRALALALGLASAIASRLPAQQPITLQQAIDRALEDGHQAQAVKATRDAARYRDKAFYSQLLPQVSLGGTVPQYNRSIIQVLQPDGSTLFQPQNQTNAALTATLSQRIPFTGGDFFVSSSLARLTVSGIPDRWQSTPVLFGFRQDILRPNATGWDRKEEPLKAEVAERQYLEAREDIALQTTNLYFDVYAAKVALENAATNAAVNDTLYTLNKGRYEVGKIGENDLLQSELALLRSRTSLDGARLEYDRTRAALRLALNLPASAPLEVAVTAMVPDVATDTARAVTEALQNRSGAANVELQDVQARRAVTAAKLSNWVGATVQASYGFNATAPEANLAYQNLLERRQFTVAVQVPIVQWGLRKESVKAAEADQDRVANASRSTMDQLAQDAHFAALELDQAKRSLALSAKADTVAGKRFEVAYNRYVIGRITIDNLYIAQNEKDQALSSYVQALRGYWQAYYRLRRATLFDFATGRPIR